MTDSTLVGHFVSSPREKEKRDSRDEREGQGRKRNRKEWEQTEKIITFPSTLTFYKDSKPCQTESHYQLDALVTKDTRHLCLQNAVLYTSINGMLLLNVVL